MIAIVLAMGIGYQLAYPNIVATVERLEIPRYWSHRMVIQELIDVSGCLDGHTIKDYDSRRAIEGKLDKCLGAMSNGVR